MSKQRTETTAGADERPRGDRPLAGAARGDKGRVRTCIGCAERVDVTSGRDGRPSAGGGAEPALVRLILGPEGEVAVDAADGGFGRGAHVHARPACLARAAQGGLARAAKATAIRLAIPQDPRDHEQGEQAMVPLSVASLAAAIAAVFDRRVQGLLGTAVRARRAVLGSDAVCGAAQRGEAALIVVACDAAASAELGEVRRAVAEGRAVAWGTKTSLAVACGKSGHGGGAAELGVVAITDAGMARSIRDAVVVIAACAGADAVRVGGSQRAGKGGPQVRRPVGRSVASPTPAGALEGETSGKRAQSRTERGA